MKGHLGFRCRYCQRPSPPRYVRQLGTGIRGNTLQATLAWDAPDDPAYVDPIVQYRIEQYTAGVGWQEIQPSSGPIPRSAVLTFCDGGSFRVSAANRCGWGDPAYYSSWIFSGGGFTGSVVTSSTNLQPPCWSTSVTAWCVGCGGTFVNGGAGGGLAWKTWTNTSAAPWGTLSLTVLNASNETGPARSSASYNGQTVTANGGASAEPGMPSGGDGGYPGRAGGTDTASFTSAGIPYSGPYYYGGAIGGCDPGGPGGTQICLDPVSPCRRLRAKDRNGFLAVAALAGFKVTEDCATAAAFGSGGVRVPYSAYGSDNQYFTPGYGGGGFDANCPAGPGVIIVQYA